jgi:hypothetical protein
MSTSTWIWRLNEHSVITVMLLGINCRSFHAFQHLVYQYKLNLNLTLVKHIVKCLKV